MKPRMRKNPMTKANPSTKQNTMRRGLMGTNAPSQISLTKAITLSLKKIILTDQTEESGQASGMPQTPN
jgi:hypothetical protein